MKYVDRTIGNKAVNKEKDEIVITVQSIFIIVNLSVYSYTPYESFY